VEKMDQDLYMRRERFSLAKRGYNVKAEISPSLQAPPDFTKIIP
jgi:hypothetical protein